jgi:CrcB protein
MLAGSLSGKGAHSVDKYLLVGLGGFLGAIARYALGGWAAEKWGGGFPYGTLLINVSGSFVLGLFLAVTASRLPLDPRWRLLFAVGFLGAYTTFSTFTYETVQLLLANDWRPALAYVGISNVLGVGAALLGVGLGRVL